MEKTGGGHRLNVFMSLINFDQAHGLIKIDPKVSNVGDHNTTEGPDRASHPDTTGSDATMRISV